MLVFFSNSLIINAICNLLLILLIVFMTFLIIAILTTIRINFKCACNSYKIIIKLYILNKIRYLKIELDKEEVLKIVRKIKEKIEIRNHKSIEKEIYQDKYLLKKIIRSLKINLEYINLDLKIGTEFILLTSVIITTISTIFPMIFNKFIKKYDEEKYYYKFTPIYNKNALNLKLDCIISIKMVHIINIIVSIIFKKGVYKNVRTSNTRFNDNCYE